MSTKQNFMMEVTSAALTILCVAVFAMGQATPQTVSPGNIELKSNSRQTPAPAPGPAQGPPARREENKRPPDATRYSYEFSQPAFYISHIVIEHDAVGRGKITFERLGEALPIVEPVELSTAALGRILGIWSNLNFLESTENYQAEKQFPHLGTMKVKMDDGKRQRSAEFNWTNNKLAGALINEYRRVADQAVLVFDLGVARENQPLNAPKLLEQFESLLTHNGLSDAYQLVPLLRELSTDEHVPLMARNHATRLLKRIEK